MSLRFRRARGADLRHAAPLLGPDRHLFSDRVWKALPRLLAEALAGDRVLLCVIEDPATAAPAFIGATAFLGAAVRDRYLDHGSHSFLEHVFDRQLSRGDAFLNRRQVAASNARSDLTLLNCFGSPGVLLGRGVPMHVAASSATTGWSFFHAGYDLRDIVGVTGDPAQAALLTAASLPAVHRRDSGSAAPQWVFRVTRDDAKRSPLTWPLSLMIAARGRFRFTASQQQLLEMALLDRSDREIARELGLSADGVKKRWRSIYARVRAVAPDFFTASDGSDLRRALLQHVRGNMAELRPYR